MAQQQRPPRAVALANGAVAASILVVVVAFGVAVSQSRPPSIAAFAPDVQQHGQQKSLQGQQGANALGASAPTGVPSTPTPSPTPNAAPGATPTPNLLAGRPAEVRCYGTPPRQTEDPQSPPCKQSFDGGNGGSTYRGVTATTINVAWPDMTPGFPGVENGAVTRDLAKFVNNHFQLYGRTIVLQPFDIAGGLGGFSSPTAQQQVQDADKAAGVAGGVFASIGYAPVGGTAYYYYDRLAQDGVVSVQSSPLLETEAHLASSPYLWSTMPGYDTVEANLGHLWCNQLKGHQPQYAGQPTPPQTSWPVRKIGVYYETTSNNLAVDPQPLIATLRGCGEQVTAQALSDDSGSNTAAINQMQQSHVTTVACLCNAKQYGDLMSAGSDQTFFPEWLVNDEQFLAIDSAGAQQSFPTEQQSHVIGIGFNNEFLDPSNEFWYRATKEADPGYAYQQSGQDVYNYYRYEELLVLASGIQQAGPDLTPQSFQQGLYATQYSNSGHGARPYYQAAVGFGPGDHSFYDDAAAIWFSTADNSYTGNQGQNGTYCYSNGGDRSEDWLKPQPRFYGGQTCRGG